MTVIAELLAATPLPPEGDGLLPAFAEMRAARQLILDRLTAPIPLVTPEDHAQAELIAERNAAWLVAIALAMEQIKCSRLNVRKLRGYRPVLVGR
jgi:hypothetical protein